MSLFEPAPELRSRCPSCGRIELQRWSFGDHPYAVAWSTCRYCDRTVIWERGVAEHPPSLAGVRMPRTTLAAILDLAVQALEEAQAGLAELELASSEARGDVRRLARFISDFFGYVPRAAPISEPEKTEQSDDQGLFEGASTGAPGVGFPRSQPRDVDVERRGRVDRTVLDVAISDEEAAERKIEELREQIASEEERITGIKSFIETYRSYEQQITGSPEGAESQPAEPDPSW